MVWLEAIGLLALGFASFFLLGGFIRLIFAICDFVERCNCYFKKTDQIEERLCKCRHLK